MPVLPLDYTEPFAATLGLMLYPGINELDRRDARAFAAQSLACLRILGIADDDARVNPNGGAIAIGHPLGMSGARIIYSAALELQKTQKRYALATMCVGLGQGYAVIIERV